MTEGSDYVAPDESGWKVRATEELTHLTDEQEQRLPGDLDRFMAQIHRDAKLAVLEELTESLERQIAVAGIWRGESEVESARYRGILSGLEVSLEAVKDAAFELENPGAT